MIIESCVTVLCAWIQILNHDLVGFILIMSIIFALALLILMVSLFITYYVLEEKKNSCSIMDFFDLFIPYEIMTSMKLTHNPFASSALSLDWN